MAEQVDQRGIIEVYRFHGNMLASMYESVARARRVYLAILVAGVTILLSLIEAEIIENNILIGVAIGGFGFIFSYAWFVELLVTHWRINTKVAALRKLENQLGFQFLKYEAAKQVESEKRWIGLKKASADYFLVLMVFTVFLVIAILGARAGSGL